MNNSSHSSQEEELFSFLIHMWKSCSSDVNQSLMPTLCSLRQVKNTCPLSHFLLQSFEKQGFHAGTPAASFSLPSALGSGGPINPPAAAGYAPAPFMHILAPHQQPHSQILHHHLQQDGQVVFMLLLFVSVALLVQFAVTCGLVHLIWTRKKRYLSA